MMLHGLVVHAVQAGDGGVQLTEVLMSLASLGVSHCRVTLFDNNWTTSTLVDCRSTGLQ